MAIYELGERQPQVADSAWVAETAVVVGDVRIAEDASVWYGTVARGDTDTLHIGRGSNIQDNSVLHADHGFPLHIGERVTVGHRAVLHGCHIGDGCLIGIGAIVLNGVTVGAGALVAAGSVVTRDVPAYAIVAGNPARVIRHRFPPEIVAALVAILAALGAVTTVERPGNPAAPSGGGSANFLDCASSPSSCAMSSA